MGCKEEERKPRTIPLNSFSMQVNGEDWKPFQAEDNPCYGTFAGMFGHYGEMPMYTIYAYRDPEGIAESWSENMLRIRVMNVTEPGTYLLDGTYNEDFDSYFMFQTRQSLENYKRYANDPERNEFVFIVDKIITRQDSALPGIKGSFSGVLYNEEDPSDSLIIEKGEYILKYMGGYNCGF